MACSDGGPKSPIAPYALSAIGTTKLPAVMYAEEGYSLEATAGTLELIAPDTYTMSLTTIETVDGNTSTYVDNETGTWQLAVGGAITLTASGGEQFTASWVGTTLTVTRAETTFLYERDR